MDPTDATSTKQRKLAAGQEDPAGKGRTALRALRLGLARAARDVLELPCAVIGATQARVPQDEIDAALGDDRLLVLIDGPERAIGVVSIDRGCLTALIQQQTMCRVTGGEVADRPFTPTDAAMIAPLIDGTFERAAKLAEIPADKECLTGFRYGAKADDMRAIMLALEANRFRVFNLTIDFDSGKMQGAMVLAIPEPEVNADEEDGALAESRARMQRSVGAAQADMMAVIGHLRLPLAKLGEMQPGDVLPLVHDKLNQADLLAIDGRKIASVRLGQSAGWRAIRFGDAVRRDLNALPHDQEFQSNALTPPVADQAQHMGMDMPQGMDFPAPATMDAPGAMPAIDAMPESEEPTMMGFPAMADDEMDMALPDMSPEAAAAEISELAGLELSEEDLPAVELDLPQVPTDLPGGDIDLPMATAMDMPLPNAG